MGRCDLEAPKDLSPALPVRCDLGDVAPLWLWPLTAFKVLPFPLPRRLCLFHLLARPLPPLPTARPYKTWAWPNGAGSARSNVAYQSRSRIRIARPGGQARTPSVRPAIRNFLGPCRRTSSCASTPSISALSPSSTLRPAHEEQSHKTARHRGCRAVQWTGTRFSHGMGSEPAPSGSSPARGPAHVTSGRALECIVLFRHRQRGTNGTRIAPASPVNVVRAIRRRCRRLRITRLG